MSEKAIIGCLRVSAPSSRRMVSGDELIETWCLDCIDKIGGPKEVRIHAEQDAELAAIGIFRKTNDPESDQ